LGQSAVDHGKTYSYIKLINREDNGTGYKDDVVKFLENTTGDEVMEYAETLKLGQKGFLQLTRSVQ